MGVLRPGVDPAWVWPKDGDVARVKYWSRERVDAVDGQPFPSAAVRPRRQRLVTFERYVRSKDEQKC